MDSDGNEKTYKIIGAAFEVYKRMGAGFQEAVYQESLEIEFRLSGIPFVAKQPLTIEYKDCPLRTKYEPDFVCYGDIVLEIKAVSDLADEHRAQILNYLRATSLSLGLLVNFGHYPKTQVERVIAGAGRYNWTRGTAGLQ